MKNISMCLDYILYVLILLTIIFENSFSSFEKYLLILVLAIFICLGSIKETIKNSNKQGESNGENS